MENMYIKNNVIFNHDNLCIIFDTWYNSNLGGCFFYAVKVKQCFEAMRLQSILFQDNGQQPNKRNIQTGPWTAP